LFYVSPFKRLRGDERDEELRISKGALSELLSQIRSQIKREIVLNGKKLCPERRVHLRLCRWVTRQEAFGLNDWSVEAFRRGV
jgi:hypothetical protein